MHRRARLLRKFPVLGVLGSRGNKGTKANKHSNKHLGNGILGDLRV